MAYIVGVDLGGTNIKAALIDQEFNIISRSMVQTPCQKPAEDTFKRIIGVIEELILRANIKKSDLLGIGIGIPGLTDSRTSIAHEVKFLKWSNTNVAEPIENHFGIPVFAENDGSVNTLGEYHFGAGKGYKNVILLTIGTGLGAGIILNGDILHGRDYVAGEIGHMVIESNGDLCACGKYGCFESCCSGKALIRYARRLVLDCPDSILLQYAQKDVSLIDGEMISRGFDCGDKACIKAVDIFTRKLSVGIVNLINIFNPGVIIIGGGVSRAGERILSPVRDLVSKSLMHPLQECNIVQGQLYTDAGVLGAAVIAVEALRLQGSVGWRR